MKTQSHMSGLAEEDCRDKLARGASHNTCRKKGEVEKGEMVGLRGFEPPTSPTPKECATGLRHSPNVRYVIGNRPRDQTDTGL